MNVWGEGNNFCPTPLITGAPKLKLTPPPKKKKKKKNPVHAFVWIPDPELDPDPNCDKILDPDPIQCIWIHNTAFLYSALLPDTAQLCTEFDMANKM